MAVGSKEYRIYLKNEILACDKELNRISDLKLACVTRQNALRDTLDQFDKFFPPDP